MRSWRNFDPSATAGPRVLPTQNLRILGLDPGSRRTGFGFVDCRGSEYAHVANGCIVCTEDTMAGRLRRIFQAVEALIEEHKPDEIAVERVFVNRNIDSALKLGQARGAALSAIPHEAPVFEYAPRAIKAAVVGYGAADKRQVAHMMTVILNIGQTITSDASDALAIAVCHAQSRRLRLLTQ
jgi:crossover junction endodeoxyribonuclease RuvC